MPPTRLQRDGATLDEIRDAVRIEFGAGARIVAAERVTTPGIGGLFRKAHVEATVEVLDPDEVPTARVLIADGPVRRVGIAALLAEADAAEAAGAVGAFGGPTGSVSGAFGDATASTRADAFASVLDGFVADGITGSAPHPTPPTTVVGRPLEGGSRLQAVTEPGCTDRAVDVVAAQRVVASTPSIAPASVRPVPPAVRSADGDLVLLVGRPNDVDAVAGLFAARHALRPTDAGDRRSGILARADGVRDGHAVLGVAAWDDVRAVEGLAPDQVWVVVDVGRKAEDAAAMLDAVAARIRVAGVVAIGAGETATPESVHLLGVPVLSLG